MTSRSARAEAQPASILTTPAGSLQLDTWQHVAVTRDSAGNADFFINGVRMNGGFSGAPVARTDFAIGTTRPRMARFAPLPD